jgi:hypothetical protein
MEQGTFTVKVSDYFEDVDTATGDALTYSIK